MSSVPVALPLEASSYDSTVTEGDVQRISDLCARSGDLERIEGQPVLLVGGRGRKVGAGVALR